MQDLDIAFSVPYTAFIGDALYWLIYEILPPEYRLTVVLLFVVVVVLGELLLVADR